MINSKVINEIQFFLKVTPDKNTVIALYTISSKNIYTLTKLVIKTQFFKV